MPVQTVLGQVEAGEMGPTMAHVHLTLNALCYYTPPDSGVLRGLGEEKVTLQNRGAMMRRAFRVREQLVQEDLDETITELDEYFRVGGGTVINVEVPGLGRDVAALSRLSRATNVKVVASTGWYTHASHPAEVEDMKLDQLRDVMVAEIQEGIESTGIRAGNIGELGMSGDKFTPFHPREEKVLRAAARAQALTGVPLTIHPNYLADHLDTYVDVLEAEGADLSKVYISHMGFWPEVAVAERMLNRGVGYLSYDGFGMEEYFGTEPGLGFARDSDEVRVVLEMLNAGHRDRIIISNQCAMKTSRKAYGGWGYSHLYDNILPWLRHAGATDADITGIMVDNPRRLYG